MWNYYFTFEHHFGIGSPMLDQQNFTEPSFADNLQYVEFVHEMNLHEQMR